MNAPRTVLIGVLIMVAVLTVACASGSVSTTGTVAIAPTTTAPATTQTTASGPTSTSIQDSATTLATPAPELAWLRVPDEEGVFGGAGMQVVNYVVSGGPGLVVVGGSESSGEADAAVWVSTDSFTWTRAPDKESALGGAGIQLINSVTVGGPGLVAVGQDDPEGSPAEGWVDSDAAVWVSADGYTWTRVPHDEAVFGGPEGQRMMSVTAGGPGLVAVGSDYRDGSGWPDAAVWVSTDGYAWTRVPDDQAVFGGPGGQEVLSVTAGGPGLVAVGSADSYHSAAVWVSADGYTWTRVPHDEAVFGGPGNQEMVAVTAGGPGLVGVGGESSGGDNVLAWVSADGYTWTRIDDEAVFGGPGSQSAAPVAAWEEGLILMGGDDSGGDLDPAVWVSAGGYKWTRLDDEAVFGGPDDQQVSSVTAWKAGLVAVGGDQSGDQWDGAVWVSPPPGD
jgi:hypothetical protein